MFTVSGLSMSRRRRFASPSTLWLKPRTGSRTDHALVLELLAAASALVEQARVVLVEADGP